MRLTVVGNENEQVIISDLAIVTLKRPMAAERAVSMQFGALGGLAVASQDKQADEKAASLRPRTMESIKGVVFNDKYKSSVVQDQAYGSDLPFYITFIIYIVKFLYYNLKFIPEKIYKNIKRLLMNGGETNFILVEN